MFGRCKLHVDKKVGMLFQFQLLKQYSFNLKLIIFPFGSYKSKTIDLLILEDPIDSTNVVLFMGQWNSYYRKKPYHIDIFSCNRISIIIWYRKIATTKSINPLILKYQLLVEHCELHESKLLQIWGSKSFIKCSWWKKNMKERF